MMAVLFLLSCRSQKAAVAMHSTLRDSASASTQVEMSLESVVASVCLDTAAERVLTRSQIDSLPQGAEYSVQTKQARASLRRDASRGLVLVAQGLSQSGPSKVTASTKAQGESVTKSSTEQKPPDVPFKSVGKEPEWWPYGFMFGISLFLFLLTAILFLRERNGRN
jgi:hypothetical protein